MESIVKELPLAIQMAPPPAGADEKLLWFVVTSGIVDRDYEVLDPDGMRVQTFLEKNPIFCYGHDLYLPAIGRVERLIKEAGRWLAGVRFADGERYPFAGLVRYLYEDGIMNSVSIRFRPVKWEDAAYEEVGFYRKYTDFELLEISAVNLPANPDAVAVRGESTGDTKDGTGAPAGGRPFTAHELIEIARDARKETPKWAEMLKHDILSNVADYIGETQRNILAAIAATQASPAKSAEGTQAEEEPGRREKTAEADGQAAGESMQAMIRDIVTGHIEKRRGIVHPGQNN